jgi:uncharacterized protein YndB with AHSA1/START domain
MPLLIFQEIINVFRTMPFGAISSLTMELNNPSTPVVAVRRSIIIDASVEKVFAYAADLRNDPHWRREVNRTTLDTITPGVGTIATEDARLSAKAPHFVTKTVCLAYEANHRLDCATIAGSPTWMRVSRTFNPLGPTSTEFSYSLEFEHKVIKLALGFNLPRLLIRWYTGRTMATYQRELKRILEGND